MKQVIEHGYAEYYANCINCKCYFKYTLDEVNEKGEVSCPDCNHGVRHNANNCDFTSQIKDAKIVGNKAVATTDGDINMSC